jgi:hypothetical protein
MDKAIWLPKRAAISGLDKPSLLVHLQIALAPLHHTNASYVSILGISKIKYFENKLICFDHFDF